jgi:dipeptidyl-peptidase-4
MHTARLRSMACSSAVVVAWLLSSTALLAQQRRLTLDDLFDPQKRQDFTGTVPAAVTWLDESTYIWTKGGGRDTTPEIVKVSAVTGVTSPFHDAAKLEAAVAAVPGVTADEARRLARPRSFNLNAARTVALLTIAGDVYTYDLAASRLARLTSDPGEELDPAFSPDARLVAFTRNGNLFVADPSSGRERQLTRDGSAELLNGRLDWVYQEEIYGRGTFRAFWWSPDSTRLAFLQLNQKPVPAFTIVDHIPHRQDLEVYTYPKAGDPNPTVKLGIVGAAGGGVTWADTSAYSAQEHLIVGVSWTPDSARVVYQLQDREQTWLDVNVADRATGAARTLFRETTGAWVDAHGDPTWLKDGTFLWLSERTGWKHVYHCRADGQVIRRITDGNWEVRTLYGVDEHDGWVYFGGTERSHIGQDVYRIRLDGTGLTRLSEPGGTHAATFNPSLTLYVGTWSDLTTPVQTRVHRADGRVVRVAEENRIAALGEHRLSRPELVQVKTRDGFVMEALLIKPPDFDPSRKYPVLQQTYAGPHAPTVRNAWGGSNAMYNQLLAQHGIIVWVCDNRSASGKGAVSAWPAYQKLGETELADIEDGIAWLVQQPWVDRSRIGISGWSYGGFMVAYALTHSASFAMGISGAPVTDWTLYDSIYTERYMRMPQHNPEGYRKSSAVRAARDLEGRLLLIHGAIDDNVHVQNSLQLAYELQKAGKPFELMIYPKSRHGITDPALVKHMRVLMLDFTLRTLQPGPQAHATSGF